MRLTPLDIREQQFRRVMRGLDPDEVTAFLVNVSEEFEALLTQNRDLRERVADYDEKLTEYRTMEKALRDTLLTAERVMTESKESAQKEASLIIREAELTSQRATSRIGEDILELRKQLAELRKIKDGYLARVKWLMRSQLEMIEVYGKDFSSVDAEIAQEIKDHPAQDPLPVDGTTQSGSLGAGSTDPTEHPGDRGERSRRAETFESTPSSQMTAADSSGRMRSGSSRNSSAPGESRSRAEGEPGSAGTGQARRGQAMATQAEEAVSASGRAARSRRPGTPAEPEGEPEIHAAPAKTPGPSEIGWSVNPESSRAPSGRASRAGEAGWSAQQFRDLLPGSDPES